MIAGWHHLWDSKLRQQVRQNRTRGEEGQKSISVRQQPRLVPAVKRSSLTPLLQTVSKALSTFPWDTQWERPISSANLPTAPSPLFLQSLPSIFFKSSLIFLFEKQSAVKTVSYTILILIRSRARSSICMTICRPSCEQIEGQVRGGDAGETPRCWGGHSYQEPLLVSCWV